MVKRRLGRCVAALVMLTALCSGCGDHTHEDDETGAGQGSQFVYDAAGRLAAVRGEKGTTAVYRYDDAGNRVAIDQVPSRDFDPDELRPRRHPAPEVTDITPQTVGQGATITITGTGFDADPMGDVVAVGGALGRVVSARSTELRVQLPPVATPGPVTVSTAYGHSASGDDLVVVPAELRPNDVHHRVETSLDRTVSLRAPDPASADPGSRILLTFRGVAGATVELHLSSEGNGPTGCEVAEVGLAGPAGTIVEAAAGDASWCGRPARLPMTGTYTASIADAGDLRATITAAASDAAATPERLRNAPVATVEPQPWDAPVKDGPPGFQVDLSSGSLNTEVTDLALGGSGAADLVRSFSVGDQDLPAAAPEEPISRHWSIAASLGLEPSMSYSYLDLVLPDGRRLPFRRVTDGAPDPDDAVFEPSGGVGAGRFAGSKVTYTGSGWELRTRTGTVLGFGRTGSPLRLSWLRDSSGQTARFVRAPDPEGGSPDGALLGVVSEDGQWARFSHDAEHRITGATNQVGDHVSYRYARVAGVYADVLVTATQRRAGERSTTVGYRYQRSTGRLAAVTNGRRDRVRFSYDDGGRVVRERVLTARGTTSGQWRYSYDVEERRVSIPGRSGTVRLPQIRRVTVGAPGGRRTVRFAQGRWISDASGAGTIRVDRQPRSGLIASIHRSAHGSAPSRTEFTYDHAGRMTTHGEATGGAHQSSYGTDPPGQSDRRTVGGLPAGYLDLGGPTHDGPAVFVDARGRRAASSGSDGDVKRVRFDPRDRPLSIIDASGATTQFTYTDSGDLASVTDPAGTTRYGWNNRGQQISETDPLGGRQQWRYDRAGRLIWSQDPRGVESTFAYDRGGRIIAARYGVRTGKPAESRVDYAYDDAGRLARIRDSAADGPASLRYDTRGNLVAETTATGTVLREYDEDDHPTDLALPDATRLHRDYDDLGRPGRLLLRADSGDVRATPRYDEAGRLAGLDLPGGVRGRLSYTHGRLSGLDYSRGGHRLAVQHATYDGAGRLSAINGDLTRPVLPDVQPEASFDAAHQLTGRVSDRGGRSRWRWDRAGHLLRDETHRYTWDVRGRLVAVTGPGGRTSIKYDALGRRAGVTTAGKTVRYVYDGDDVIQSVTADGTHTTYLRGPDGTALASTSNGGRSVTALLPDVLGNVGAGVGADHVKRTGLDPFGQPATPTPADQPGFRGLLADPSGQLPMGDRVYDPSTGRFLSRDSWGIDGGDTNLYRYALGAPTVYTDPSGHASECVGIALGWAMSVLGPGGGWDDYDALEDQAQSGQVDQDEWTLRADKISHDLWAGFDVVANVCGTSAVGTSVAALPLLGSSKVTSRVLGSLADDAVTGAAATRGEAGGLGQVAPGVSLKARAVLDRLLRSHEPGLGLSPSTNRVYSTRVLVRMADEPGPMHNFPVSFDRTVFEQGTRTVNPGYFRKPEPNLGSGSVQYRLQGEINGRPGVYEIFTRPSTSGRTEMIMHRFFRPGAY